MLRNILTSIALGVAMAASAADVWVEAEAFDTKGGWVVDQQFADLMGSTYLMAHGLGKPVADATTTVQVPADGRYDVYVRTYNWTSPWTTAEGPGRFRVRVGKHTLPATLGAAGDCWQWQKAGSVRLRKGATTLALRDLTGFNGRCDAVVLTTDPNPVLPDGGDELAAVRRKALGLDGVAPDTLSYDMVVVGGGIAGMCAAVSAARGGLQVALVNDRPVLGGNNSAEVRVHLGGHIELGPNEGLGRMIREFGHSRRGNAMPADYYEDEKKQAFIDGEPGVTLFSSTRAYAVEMDGDRIAGVAVRHIENAKETVLRAPLFADCTGDATIGYLAGAHWTTGREGRAQYGEPLAPEQPDSLTMGASVQWYTRDEGRPVSFPEFSYGLEFNDTNCERVTMGEWTWETGMNRDQIADAERIRDYGLLVIFSNWSHLKNHAADRAPYRNRSLDWAAYIAGKRESRRLLGDYVLKQDDIDKGVFHEDASFCTSWSLDLHFADPKNSRHFPDREFKAATKHIWVQPYAVPYRCLYSRNVPNLFMAGRNISVTHVALGTVRVMRTTGMMGEVVGLAAGLCKKHATTPRGVYQEHLPELCALMREGAGRSAELLPDNQNFNRANHLLDAPRALGGKPQ